MADCVVWCVWKGVCGAVMNCYTCEFDNLNPRVSHQNCGDPFDKDNATGIETFECGGECMVRPRHASPRM